MNIQNELKQLIVNALMDTTINYLDEIVLDYPADLSQGDFATPIALKLSKQLGQSPRDVAQKITDAISSNEHDFLESVAVAGPGFINFTLSEQYWAGLKQLILEQQSQWGTNESLAGQKYLMEHTSVNLFKPFHIGHLLSNVTGESLNRIVKANGAETTVISYPSDKSPGIAKAVWGLYDLFGKETYEKLASPHINDALNSIGEAYAHATEQYKNRPELEPLIKQITKDIYEENNSFEDVNYYGIYEQGKKLSLDYFQKFTKKMGSNFEGFIFESQAEEAGKQVISEHMDVYTESDGAVIFKGSDYGLFDNVFVNSAGFATYLGKDVGLLALKAKQYPDHSKWYYVIDTEQKPHFQLMNKSVEQFNADWASRGVFVHHGRLALTTGKISSRSGNVPMAEDLLNQVMDASFLKVTERDVTKQQAIAIAEQIAQASLKYAVLKAQTGKNITLDLEKDLSFEGQSGPYIQYSYVRAVNALAKIDQKESTGVQLREGKTPDLERMLVRYPKAVEKALTDNSPHHVAGYLFELASEFSSFYANTKIADESNLDMQANVQLTQAFAQTIKNGLDLLGIETVEQM